MKIAVVGLGLIGGSFAKALREYTHHQIYGYDLLDSVVQKAVEEGTLDGGVSTSYQEYDLVVIALYPDETLAFLQQHHSSFRPGCYVVDLCGIKRAICQKAAELLSGTGVTFVGGHPMAGKEFWGYDSADPALFQGASMILTPFAETSPLTLNFLGDFFRSLGFARITITTPEHHDEIIAFTSQLAHILSSAYIQSPTASQFMGFSAGSFKDLTRVAKLNEDMWTNLFLHNADYLTTQLDVILENLTVFRDALAQKDAAVLKDRLKQGRLIKEKLG